MLSFSVNCVHMCCNVVLLLFNVLVLFCCRVCLLCLVRFGCVCLLVNICVLFVGFSVLLVVLFLSLV